MAASSPARTSRQRSTRELLLDAAYDAVVAGDWQRTRMLDVASAAGVSRQTLYNEFGSKEALGQALALREAQRFADGVQRFLDEAHPARPADAVAGATVWTLREAADNPLVKAALIDDAGGLLPFLTTRGEPLLAVARGHMTDYFHQHWPDIPAADLELAAEVVSRLTVSYLVLPSDAADATAEAVGERLARLVERLLGHHPRRKGQHQ